MIYTIEPGLFKIKIEKKVKMNKFPLGSIHNYSVGQENSQYLQEIAVRCSDFQVPETWNFRKAFYFIKDNVWYSSRDYKFMNFKFRYIKESNVFDYYPAVLSDIPFVFNGFYPIGLEVGNILLYEMMKKGYVALRACAFSYRGKIVLFIAPSRNGKTTLVRDLIKRDEKVTYISEDIVLLTKDRLIGFPPRTSLIRESNRRFNLEDKDIKYLYKNPDYIFYYNVCDVNSLSTCSNIVNFPAIETYFYFSESIVSAMMYYDDINLEQNLFETYRNVFSRSKNYTIKTNGYNLQKVIKYLNEVIE